MSYGDEAVHEAVAMAMVDCPGCKAHMGLWKVLALALELCEDSCFLFCMQDVSNCCLTTYGSFWREGSIFQNCFRRFGTCPHLTILGVI